MIFFIGIILPILVSVIPIYYLLKLFKVDSSFYFVGILSGYVFWFISTVVLSLASNKGSEFSGIYIFALVVLTFIGCTFSGMIAASRYKNLYCKKEIEEAPFELNQFEKKDISHLKKVFEEGKCPICGENIDKNLTKCFSCNFDFYESGLME